jgi:NAD(P)-dependent dehydrogenase (short-subunit alcohol dehydrogenase family)
MNPASVRVSISTCDIVSAKIHMSKTLTGKVAVVAGASRGCGRGIALALGDAGATIYVTARTTRDGPAPVDHAPGTIEETAEEVTRRGGHGIPVRIDHTDPAQVEEFFAQLDRNHGRLDVLACAVWGGNERFVDPAWRRPFWEQPASVWQECIGAGPCAFWLAARAASRIMATQKTGSGLVVAISEPILENVEEFTSEGDLQMGFYHLAHYSTNRLINVLGRDAAKAGIAVIGLLPGFMRTERVEMHLHDEELRKVHRYDLTESTEYAGRAVVALAADPNVSNKSGKLVYVADLANEYGFTDIDGKCVENFYRVMGLIKD